MAARFVATSRLSNIIQMITLSHQTGILRVARTQGTQREMGQIHFVQGEPVSALLGEMTGGAALNVLANWGECAYAFDTSADPNAEGDPNQGSMGDATGGYPMAPSSAPNTSPNVSSSWPTSYGYLNTPPFAPAPTAPAPTRTPQPRSQSFPPLPQGPNSGASYAPDNYQTENASGPPYRGPGAPYSGAPDRVDRLDPTRGQGYSQPLANLPNLPNLNYPGYSGADGASFPGDSGALSPSPRTPSPPPASMAAPTAPSVYNLQPETLARIPIRTPMATSVEQLPLDRRERMVLLLIDGQRSISDLIRLTRRSEQELYAVLNHLRLLGLLAM